MIGSKNDSNDDIGCQQTSLVAGEEARKVREYIVLKFLEVGRQPIGEYQPSAGATGKAACTPR